ncbi:hypothetical protein [Shewanella japonica]|uniref:hypothetical protein n=1 Tax=Shewanella japonica TaxID=93973 RepID=UPI00249412E4|nr:hypothetical protein [Shewanella japonica]
MNRFNQIFSIKYRTHLEKKVQKNQSKVVSEDTFPQVKWLSYHIPKTAGTSLRFSLEKGLGMNRIQYAYQGSFAKELSQGKPVWCNNKTDVLHGHFTHHENHSFIYPNAQKMVWLRDPSVRAWSLFNHWLRVKSGLPYKWMQEEYFSDSKLTSDTHLLFEQVIMNKRFKNQFSACQTYLNGLDKQDLAFIGQCESFGKEIIRLESILSVKLPLLSLNTSTSKNKICDRNKGLFTQYFQDEYDFYHELIKV